MARPYPDREFIQDMRRLYGAYVYARPSGGWRVCVEDGNEGQAVAYTIRGDNARGYRVYTRDSDHQATRIRYEHSTDAVHAACMNADCNGDPIWDIASIVDPV